MAKGQVDFFPLLCYLSYVLCSWPQYCRVYLIAWLYGQGIKNVNMNECLMSELAYTLNMRIALFGRRKELREL